jgi:hypothetical protein
MNKTNLSSKQSKQINQSSTECKTKDKLLSKVADDVVSTECKCHCHAFTRDHWSKDYCEIKECEHCTDTTTQGDDSKPFIHGEEGTHSACKEMIEKLGANVGCCTCNGHKCLDQNNGITENAIPKKTGEMDDSNTDSKKTYPTGQASPVERVSKEKHPTGEDKDRDKDTDKVDSIKKQIRGLMVELLAEFGVAVMPFGLDPDPFLALFQSELAKPLNVGFLRQYLNEDRITDPNKMVTNEEIEHMLGVEPDKTLERVREKIIQLTIEHPERVDALTNYESMSIMFEVNRTIDKVLAILEAEQKGTK